MSLHAAAVAALAGWRAPSVEQEALRRDFLAHLAAHPDALSKQGPTAHLTASCVVLDPAGEQVLLTHHAKGDFWVQFGGHLEPGDADLAAGALREAREESGLDDVTLLTGDPVDLNRHALPSAFGRCTEHLDTLFVAVAPAGAVPRVSDESHDVAWWPVDALPADAVSDLPGRLGRVVELVRSRAAAGG